MNIYQSKYIQVSECWYEKCMWEKFSSPDFKETPNTHTGH